MKSNKPLQLVQITDPHLHASLDGTLLGLTTQFSLDLVLDQIRKEHHGLDVVIGTGDIAQDSSTEAYRRFRSILEGFGCENRWCPGNHDVVENMKEAANGSDLDNPILEIGEWVIVLLNSAVPGKVYGRFADDQLELLENTLNQYSDKHVLVTFHHHPIEMGSVWIDKQRIKNGDDLVALVEKHNNVRAVVWGHVHQETDRIINGVRYISTPSTCVQFTPGKTDFDIDKAAPGYRWFKLHEDGGIETGVSRIEGVDFEIDYSVKGY